MIQLKDTQKCHICDRELAPKNKGIVLDGFYDKDTNQYCHFGDCQVKHYYLKARNSNYKITVSEMPVVNVRK